MNGYLCAVRVIFLGLLTSQIIALIQVYLSNTGLYHALLAISEAGYLAIPNQEIVPSLQGFRPAFFGGLFFSLTIGAGLSLLSYAVIWVWDRLFSRNKYLGIFFLLLWLGCLSAVNHKGLEPMVTSYFFFIPAVVTIASLRWIHPKYGQKKWRHIAAMFFIPLFLLAILWRSQATSHLFIDLRDYLLLSNRLGVKINDFYYRYTLYAAEVFKALDQKLLKTYRLGDIQDVFLVPTIEKELAENDYLRVDGYPSVDLNVSQEGNFLVFKHRDRTILKAIPSEFFSNPGKVLKEFSLKSDRHGFFRKFTFISLLLGSPVILYLIFFTMFYMFLSFFLDNRTSSLFASILCFMIGITLLGLLHNSEAEIGEVKNVTEALRSQRWQERIAALKTIEALR